MSRRSTALLLALSLATATASAAGCAAPAETTFSGTVVVDTYEIEVPRLVMPEPDLTVGQQANGPALSGTSADGATNTGTKSMVVALTSSGQRSLVTSASVDEGDRVEAGQVVAVVDDALLRAGVRQAAAGATRSRRDIGVIDSRLDDVAEGRATLAEKRADLVATIGDLERTRADLVKRRAEARSALAQLERIPLPPPGSTPPTLPPGAPNPAVIRGNIAKLRAGLAQLDAGIAKLDNGLAKAREGLLKMASARADLNDARAQLEDLSDLARVGADVSAVAVDLARAQLGLATLRSPVSGVVVAREPVGSVLAPGAPAVTVLSDSPRRVRLWLSANDVRSIAVGDAADVRLDALASTFRGRVTLVGSSAGYPPTSLATSEIHLTQATAVEVTLDDPNPLPPGVPADVTFITE